MFFSSASTISPLSKLLASVSTLKGASTVISQAVAAVIVMEIQLVVEF